MGNWTFGWIALDMLAGVFGLLWNMWGYSGYCGIFAPLGLLPRTYVALDIDWLPFVDPG